MSEHPDDNPELALFGCNENGTPYNDNHKLDLEVKVLVIGSLIAGVIMQILTLISGNPIHLFM